MARWCVGCAADAQAVGASEFHHSFGQNPRLQWPAFDLTHLTTDLHKMLGRVKGE